MSLSEIYEKTVTLMSAYFIENHTIEVFEVENNIEMFLKYTQEDPNSLHTLLELITTDYSDASHSVNVAFYSILLAKTLDYSQEQLLIVGTAALLHDLGKRNISAEILNKTTLLSDDEFKSLQEYPNNSKAKAIEFGITNPSILSAIVSHHENNDGTGYPNGLKGKSIPIMGQIIAICDAFDALSTDRTYRQRYPLFDALLLIRDERNEHFRSTLIYSFFNLFHQ